MEGLPVLEAGVEGGVGKVCLSKKGQRKARLASFVSLTP